jgi:hypothetical protein
LDCPSSLVGLFTGEELLLLAKARAWPLPGRAIRFLRTAPAVRRAKVKRRRNRWLSDLFAASGSETALLRRLLWAVLKSHGEKGVAR